jgi:nicotinic acid mononucleotide adenylyltransferase
LRVRMVGRTVEAKETVEVEAMRGRKKKRTRNTLVHVRAAQKISRNYYTS